MNRLLLGFILLVLCACTENDIDQQVDVVQEDNNTAIVTTGISKINGVYKIDSLAILTNENLDTLIAAVEEADLVTYKDVADIPPFIRTVLDSLTGGDFSIVNYGEDWQETDVIMGKLPERELLYLGKGDDITLLAYYTGGIGKSEHILIFRHKNGELTDFWAGNVLKNLKTKEDIVRYLKENKNKEWGLNTNRVYL